MQDVDQRLTRDVDRLCTDLAELIPTMVRASYHILPVCLTWLGCLRWCLPPCHAVGKHGRQAGCVYPLV